MKKTIVSIIIALSMLLTGCWDLVEPEKLGLVTLVGMDSSGGQIKVIIHEMSQQKQSSGTQMDGAGGATIKLHEATAPTISEAIQKIAASDFRRTYFSHVSAVVLSEELVSSIGITPIANYFERDPEITSAVWLLIAKEGQFDRIFSISTSVEPGASTGKIIEGIIRNRPALFFSANTMVDILNLIWEKGSEPYTSGISLIEIPAAKVKQEAGARAEESNKYDLIIENTAVFKEDKMVGWMNNEESTGLLWVTGKIRWGDLKIQMDGKDVVLRIQKADSRIKPLIEDEKILMNINVVVASDILESQANIDYQQNEVIDKVQDLLAEKIKKQIIAAFNKSKMLESDVFGFGNYIFGKYPKYWEQLSTNWYEYYPDIDINIEVNAKVNHTGLSRK